MCPSATADGEIVINGWSPSKRNSYFANSGIVVEVKDEDLNTYQQAGCLAGVRLQQSLESSAFELGGGKQVAPAQRLTDFIQGRGSQNLPTCSYLPGVRACDLRELFPKSFHERLARAFNEFERKQRGYVSEEAIMVAVESRTSSPVRIPRAEDSYMHPDVPGLFPAGEGAGYAGGIMSAAMDGENAATELADFFYGASSIVPGIF